MNAATDRNENNARYVRGGFRTSDPVIVRFLAGAWNLSPPQGIQVGCGACLAASLIQGDQKVSVHLMITIQEVTSNVESVSRQSPDVYWHAELNAICYP
jgi:hypothetical protein